MAFQSVSIVQFLELSLCHPVFDVRSPSEYEHAHIPGAFSLPLFDDEERRIVGTAYKQQSREEAIKIGLDYFGSKMRPMVVTVEESLKSGTSKVVLVHCWRGGLRSSAVAWLLDLYGFEVMVLDGGYKNYRRWVLERFALSYSIRILGGFTGSGKTEILHKLRQLGHPVIDLEGLAHHKGSSFGALGQPTQPGNEMFENQLAMELDRYNKLIPGQPIWLESESSRIGCININHVFFQQMKSGDYIRLMIPREERLKKIVTEYGSFDKDTLIAAVIRIKKRLGGLETQNTINYILQGDISSAFEILLAYYDRFYEKSEIFNPPTLSIELPDTNAAANANNILEALELKKDI